MLKFSKLNEYQLLEVQEDLQNMMRKLKILNIINAYLKEYQTNLKI